MVLFLFSLVRVNFIFAELNIETNTLSQERNEIQQKSLEIPNNPKNYNGLLNIFIEAHDNLTKANRDYLTILVSIFGILLGILYLFNFRPFQKNLDEQEQELRE